MSRPTRNFEQIRELADEIAALMASRLGGAQRGERPTLEAMLRRRGGALPGRLRNPAQRLARADRLASQPRIARQLPLDRLARDHAALAAHLRPLGEISRWQGRAVSLASRLALTLLLLAALAIWLTVLRARG
ncbi:hypothetical protein [Paracoccus tibetensis]|uniref:Uncharacterized protein n=1 Tax=Paracoccus tibetensis TaxID=336292 RepID=A0A1G5DDQ9_9RHOB|nr:hypothetical protein [Paracoccus tibetensis]SCY12893.1 hypothetical protein SAMN05660710_00768 [Paracoccus tibetensis]